MQNSARVERVVIRYFGGTNVARGNAEALRHLKIGLGIQFHENGELSWPIDWSKRLREPNASTTLLCDFSASILRSRRLDLIVTFDVGGNTPMLAETLARRTSERCHQPIGAYSVRFSGAPGEKRMQRIISYDGDPRRVIAGKRIFLLADVLEQNSLILRLAKEIVVFGKKQIEAGRPELAPTIVGIGAPVIRDVGIKQHVRSLLGTLPELHYLVRARKRARPTATVESAASNNIFSLEAIRHERPVQRSTAHPQ